MAQTAPKEPTKSEQLAKEHGIKLPAGLRLMPTAPKGARKRTPEDENRSARFQRLANQRMPKVLASIASVGNLAGSSYSYTEEQATKIVNDLTAAVAAVKAAFFKPARGKDQEKWSL